MTKLTDTQISVLAHAAARVDGAASLPERLTRSAAAKVAGSLVSRKLMREVRAKAGMPVWREGEGRMVALVILKAGRSAISSVVQTEPPANLARASDFKAPAIAENASSKPLQTALNPSPAGAAGAPRQGSKQALVVDMLTTAEGATLDSLTEATGWLPHTTRAALTGLRKRGYGIERARGADGAMRYLLRPAHADVQA